MAIRGRALIAAVSIALLGAAVGSTGIASAGVESARQVPGTSCPMFPDDNYWRARIDSLPINTSSAQWMSNMHPSTSLHPDFGPSFGEQEVPYGMPITVVHGAARVPVTFDYADESDKVTYPLNKDTLIEGGANANGDRHAIVVDADSCTLFETWNTRQTAGGWTAGSGAVWSLKSNKLRPKSWTSADAAGLPILPGLLRWVEVKAGQVDHAIRFTTDVTQRAFIWPARHQAGSTDSVAFPPMGARFRLKSGYSTSGYSKYAQVVLTAMKRYGLVLADNGSPWYFQGDADPAWPSVLIAELKRIPASAFEAVDTARLQVSPNSAAVRQK
ncbi:MAG: hypothetical protein Q7L55_11755 [Actinomycetota bacterium]|nr:hypothetical protein [Actinomycetota bacterium]